MSKHTLVNKYLNGKLTVAGRTQLPAPVEPILLSRRDIHTLLPQPLKRLSINQDGDLVLPSLDSCPVQVNQHLRDRFAELEKEFPQKQQPPASGGNPAPAGDPVPPTEQRLAPGTALENREGLFAAGWSTMKESPPD